MEVHVLESGEKLDIDAASQGAKLIRTAISMSISQILKSEAIICAVPNERKAKAIKCAVEGEVNNICPASILQEHNKTWIYLDQGSSSLLK